MLVRALVPLAFVGCHRDPPAPAVEHPHELHGRAFAIAGIDTGRAAIAHADDDASLRLSLWTPTAIAWSVQAPCGREDQRSPRAWPTGVRFVALTAGPDVITISCPGSDGVERTTAFRTADGTRAWVTSPRQTHGGTELHAVRAGASVIVYDGDSLDAHDAASGSQRISMATLDHAPAVWAAAGRLAIETSTTGPEDVVKLIDTATGATVATAKGSVQCALPDGVIVVHGNDRSRVALDGTQTPLANQRFTVADSACSVRDDRLIVGSDIEAGERLTEIARDGTQGRSVLVPHAGGSAFAFSWDRPLPRFIPVATHGDEVVIVDLDAMQPVRTLRFDIDAPVVSGVIQLAAGRHGDVFVGLASFGPFGIDGTTGAVLTLEDPLLANLYWLDLDAETRSSSWFVPRATNGVLTLAPAALVADGALAKALVAHAL